MRAWKLGLASFFVGIALSIAPIATYAACAQTVTYRDWQECHIEYTAHLDSQSCNSEGVCVCFYVNDNNCGHWVDGPCPESGAQ
jgi:hypothetical protein